MTSSQVRSTVRVTIHPPSFRPQRSDLSPLMSLQCRNERGHLSLSEQKIKFISLHGLLTLLLVTESLLSSPGRSQGEIEASKVLSGLMTPKMIHSPAYPGIASQTERTDSLFLKPTSGKMMQSHLKGPVIMVVRLMNCC